MCQEALALLAFLPGAYTSLSFSKSKRTSSCWVATEAARRHPHLHCTSLNLPAQKGTIKQPTKQMRFPYIRQTVITFPMLSLFLCRNRSQKAGSAWGWGGHSVACKASRTLALHTKRGVRSNWDVSFGASANNITGGNALGDVLQALIPFVS